MEVLMPIYSNVRICEVIDDYIHDPRYRAVLKLRLCDNTPYEKIAEEVNFSTQYTKEIVKKYKAMVFDLL